MSETEVSTTTQATQSEAGNTQDIATTSGTSYSISYSNNTLTNGTSAGSIYIPAQQQSSSGLFANNYGGVFSSGTYPVFSAPKNQKYSVFKLPTKVLPEAVVVCGRMLTVGALGTDVECAYTGTTLIFAEGVLNALTFNNHITLILQYADYCFHYKIDNTFGTQTYEPNSNIVKSTLLSKTKRGQTAEPKTE